MAEHRTKVLIVGSGAAGCTAAIYAARANMEPIMVTGMQPGGQLTITTDVENYPGFAEPVQGPWLMEQMQEQAKNVGTTIFNDLVTGVDLSKRPFTATGDSGDTYTGDVLIISTGASARWLGLEGETTFQGMGVSACATCDGFFYRGDEIVVVGGGNTAVEEALFLTNFASKVTLIHRRDELRAERILQDRLFNNPKIETLWFHQLDEVLGDDNPKGVTGVRVRHTGTGETRDIPCKGVFIAIGHAPASELVKDKVEMHHGDYVRVEPGTTRTSIPGLFAAGDLTDHIYRQAVTSAGMGCMAALDAERFLAEQGAISETPEPERHDEAVAAGE